MTPSEAPPSPPAGVGEEVRAAQERLRRSITIAGLIDDPMRHVLEALATHIGAQHRMHADAGAMLAEAIRRAQQPVSDETIRLEAAAANGADRRAFGIIREHWRRNIMLAAGVLFGVALLFGAMGVAAGYFWGRAKGVRLGASDRGRIADHVSRRAGRRRNVAEPRDVERSATSAGGARATRFPSRAGAARVWHRCGSRRPNQDNG